VKRIAAGLFESQAFRTILLIAVMLVLAGIAFMASVKSEMQTASVSIAGLLVLIVIVDAFRQLGKK